MDINMTPYYNLTKLLAATLFKKDSPIIPENAIPDNSRPGRLLNALRQLIASRSINVAENMLFDSFDVKQPVFLAIGLEFYARLSEMSEDDLREQNFSVEEIGEGIRDMLAFYKIKIALKKAPDAANAPSAPSAGEAAPVEKEAAPTEEQNG